jgi:RNA polymerase sigma-70 factor (ECF subfamily)
MPRSTPVTREPRVEETDPTLIRAAAAGDLDAFEQIVRLHQQHVWRFLRRLLDDEAAAEDVAQETFLRAFRRLPTFTFQARFSTWLLQVARNAGIDELRARRRREHLADALRPAAAATAAGGAAQAGQARAEIDAALASLPVDLRETLLLVEVLGLRYADTATVLGVPLGTVKSRIFAARSQLARWARAGDGDGTDRGEGARRGAHGQHDRGPDPANGGEAGREL